MLNRTDFIRLASRLYDEHIQAGFQPTGAMVALIQSGNHDSALITMKGDWKPEEMYKCGDFILDQAMSTEPFEAEAQPPILATPQLIENPLDFLSGDDADYPF